MKRHENLVEVRLRLKKNTLIEEHEHIKSSLAWIFNIKHWNEWGHHMIYGVDEKVEMLRPANILIFK